jgi:general secretion pathway protein C
LATLVRVDRKRVIFKNTNNGRLEYIEIKDENSISFERGQKKSAGPIDQRGNNFTLQRSMVDKLLSNLPEHLQQARAVPYIPPGSNKVEGFIILDITQGSIFEQIGLKKNDVIKGVNGQKVDSPAKALEFYNELKNSPGIALDIERDGRTETFNYTIQ